MKSAAMFAGVLCLVAAVRARSDSDTCCETAPPRPTPQDSRLLIHKIPKRFASVVQIDFDRRTVALLVEGEEEPRTWEVLPEAEIRVGAWWGRLEQFEANDRVWVWFQVDRDEKPLAIILLTDEFSEQDLHNEPYVVASIDAEERTLAVRRAKDEQRTLLLPAESASSVEPGAEVFLQANGDTVRRLVPAAELERARDEQKAFLRSIWKERGLPASVTLSHPFTDEMEVLIDHEGMHWSRALRADDPVEIVHAGEVLHGSVDVVEPWREQTRVRLIVKGNEQSTLCIGQRIGLRVPEPSAEILESRLPPDMNLQRTKEERIEWLLASTYCTCSISNDFCTGMLYTLASCSSKPIMCGMPDQFRAMVGKLIDEGLSDVEVLAEIRKRGGELYRRPHIRR